MKVSKMLPSWADVNYYIPTINTLKPSQANVRKPEFTRFVYWFFLNVSDLLSNICCQEI